jgi:hypothetical protein
VFFGYKYCCSGYYTKIMRKGYILIKTCCNAFATRQPFLLGRLQYKEFREFRGRYRYLMSRRHSDIQCLEAIRISVVLP